MSTRFNLGLFQQLNYIALTLGTSLLVPIVIITGAVGFTVLVPGLIIDTTILTIYFIIMCTGYNVFIMIVLALMHVKDGEDTGHYFSILIPSHNEEKVIERTLNSVFRLDYPTELFEVVVINDGSTDKTEEIITRLQQKHHNLKLLNVPKDKGGRGKSAALNTGLADFLLTWRGLEVNPRHRWIIGVFDSDADPQSNMLKKVSFQFNKQDVGGVQTLVRIKNREKSFLAKLQDIEFLAFARVMQNARNSYNGSVALGGNGQFVRASALDASNLQPQEEYWRNNSLTEDLDLGVRLLANKWKNIYVDTSYVSQEGTETLLPMFKQRERWAWGTLQVLKRYIFNPKFWKTKISFKVKVDISLYLINALIPLIVALCWILTGLSLLGIIRITNFFPLAITLVQGFSFLPLLGYGLWTQRTDYPRWQIIPLIIITTVYTYHWIPCVMSALIKTVTTKPKWVKTPRFATLN
jgi:1,2-diacylglycerol 3-beta-glucosyltransferase